MRKLILKNFQSPGDIVMLTAAVRDLHRCYPGEFLTDVRTACAGLWENNPYLTPLEPDAENVESIDCEYPLIHRSNQQPWHFLHGFIEFLNSHLELRMELTEFRGDIHLAPGEKSWMSQVQELTADPVPFWIVDAGGKYDYTIKWWAATRYQEVVDYFRGRVLFVQIGEQGHHHPALRGVIDLRGKTDLRQLVRLVYHAQGVLGPVSLPMHLAAAVETPPGSPKNRPCVVIAGGREPPNWEAYPHHQFIHTVGALRCCDNGGCWKARTIPLGDGDSKDEPGNLCVDVVGSLPRCMDMVAADEVVRRIETYFTGGVVEYLSDANLSALERLGLAGADSLGGSRPLVRGSQLERRSQQFLPVDTVK
jgi:ADP-heptose:LPS heptosyltransferase